MDLKQATADERAAEACKYAVEVRAVKLPRSQMRTYAHKLLAQQGGVCPLCRKPIDMSIKGEGVIDHDHDTGRIRGVLHRSCNAAEGKASNAIGQWGAKSTRYEDILEFMEQLLVYLRSEPTRYIYPFHKTPEEKADARKAKIKARKAEAKARIELRRRNAAAS